MMTAFYILLYIVTGIVFYVFAIVYDEDSDDEDTRAMWGGAATIWPLILFVVIPIGYAMELIGILANKVKKELKHERSNRKTD